MRSRWWTVAALLAALACLIAAFLVFPQTVVERLPRWAQRHIALSVDRHGGMRYLLEVDASDVKKQRIDALRDDARGVLREARIASTNAIRGDGVEIRIREGTDVPQALNRLRELAQPLGGPSGGAGKPSVDVVDAGDGLIRLTPTPAAIAERNRHAVERSIPVIEKRLDEIGTLKPTIQARGDDRILVQIPGPHDPSRVTEMLRFTARLTFRLVDLSARPGEVTEGQAPAGSEVLRGLDNVRYLVERRALLGGEDLIDAQASFDSRTSEPVVLFRFNTRGARVFAQVTQENVGKPFAIVLDNKVLSAPVIREPILGGSGQISGNFTVHQANDLAIVLRTGELPVRLIVLEEGVVAPR